jgi:hypothetical protein
LRHIGRDWHATLSFTCRAGISAWTIGREDLWAFPRLRGADRGRRRAHAPGHRSALFYSQDGQGKLRTLGFRALERERARDYLARLCADLLTGALDVNGAATGVHPYLLPHEAVLGEPAQARHPLLDEIDELCSEAEGAGRSFSSLQGPVPRVLDRYAAPAAQEPRTWWRRVSACSSSSRWRTARESDPRAIRVRGARRLGRGHNVVESSAGTGKTFLLEHLFVDLILTHGLSCEEILVVTFTEKATAELVMRLRALIARLANLRADDAKAIEAAEAPADASWLIDEKAKKLLGEALLAFDRASIFTIHGFCQRVLREHAFVQGRFFDEELIGEEAAFTMPFTRCCERRSAATAPSSLPSRPG